MLRYLKQICLTLFIFSALSACEKKDPKHVKLTVQLNKAKNARIDIVSNNMLNGDSILLATSTLDSTGSGIIEFALEKPIFTTIQCADQYYQLYLTPGDELKVEPDTSKTGDGVRYTGDGASVQKYLKATSNLQQKYENVDGVWSIEAKLEDYLVRLDSLKKGYARYYDALSKNGDVSKEALSILAVKNKMNLYFYQQNYARSNFDAESGNVEMPAVMADFLRELPDDSIALQTQMYEYRLVLTFYLQSRIFADVWKKLNSAKTKYSDRDLPGIVEKEIESRPISPALKEHFRAANIDYSVRMDGLSPELKMLRTNFLKDAKTTLYTAALNKSFAKWESLEPGKPAPDFTGTTPDGKSISLSSLKGKVVYVDVWATWCGPCRAEFPHSKKLMKEFEGNDKIAFLFLSTDSDRDEWKKLLPDKSIPKGIHMHQKQDRQPDAIWENYHLWGIPRYILIDQEGKMIMAHAPRPSSGEVGKLLREKIKI
ncbi:TlpA disulfide reductase family protein [Dyadobacter sp. CY323]|uniref:TlpA family protein disulfide reductase n=1 Tax=Dyadobacter sp. CY323 TaxID=2907302 RepID=UPI001F367BB0|nr:TlpA disulfide reductase family protein [Dyadobacter sp. CY323]MCE6991932.1 TlpA family protein disulfide reductase [Dyadobacter sp. CY323]